MSQVISTIWDDTVLEAKEVLGYEDESNYSSSSSDSVTIFRVSGDGSGIVSTMVVQVEVARVRSTTWREAEETMIPTHTQVHHTQS